MLLGFKGQFKGFASVSGFLVENDSFVIMRLISIFKVFGSIKLLIRARQNGHVPDLLIVTLFFTNAYGIGVGLSLLDRGKYFQRSNRIKNIKTR